MTNPIPEPQDNTKPSFDHTQLDGCGKKMPNNWNFCGQLEMGGEIMFCEVCTERRNAILKRNLGADDRFRYWLYQYTSSRSDKRQEAALGEILKCVDKWAATKETK